MYGSTIPSDLALTTSMPDLVLIDIGGSWVHETQRQRNNHVFLPPLCSKETKANFEEMSKICRASSFVPKLTFHMVRFTWYASHNSDLP